MVKVAEELLHRLTQGFAFERVDHPLAEALTDDELGLNKDREVARNCRLRQIEIAHDVADVVILLLKKHQDLPSCAIRKRLKSLDRGEILDRGAIACCR